MRFLFALIALAIAHVWTTSASAQPIVTSNPRDYAETLANTMGVSGMAPLRSVYVQIANGGVLPANIEAALITYERGLPSTRAVIARVTEDVTLSDTFRSIYLFHYYGQNYWVHTRVDFVRISEGGEWAVSFVGFSNEWNGVVLATTPGFRSANRN